MALEYGSGITGGCNCHLKVKLRGQLEVKQQNKLYRTYGCLFKRFMFWNPYMTLEYWSDVIGGLCSNLKV